MQGPKVFWPVRHSVEVSVILRPLAAWRHLFAMGHESAGTQALNSVGRQLLTIATVWPSQRVAVSRA
jgi:hypothetical protein